MLNWDFLDTADCQYIEFIIKRERSVRELKMDELQVKMQTGVYSKELLLRVYLSGAAEPSVA